MTPAPASPYVGAEPLGYNNPIFGRDREIRDLFFLLSKERIALLYSPSGAGKSSILHARNGLLDQFAGRFDVLPVTRVNTETKLPGANRYALSMLLGLERFAEAPRKDSELAALSLRDAVLQRPSTDENPLTLIVVDQFEEIVRIDPTDINGKREFFRQLGELLAEPTIWALFVLREDFLATLDPYIRQLPTHLKNRYRIDLLKPEQAEKAISGPAEGLERTWDPEAARKLAENLAAETGAVEPMHLQVVCQDIWMGMRPDDRKIDPEDVKEFGDVDLVLGRFYARIAGDAAKLGHNSEREIRNWVGSKLVVKGGVRGQVLAAEAQLHDKTIEVLDKAHLIRREPRRGADWLELAHDRLVPAVTRNNTVWFGENLSDLERRAEQWDIGGRSEDLLSVGSTYRAMRAWAKQHPARVMETEASFLKASRRKASGVMWRRILTGSTVLLAIASWIAMGFMNEAREAALKAEKSAIEKAYEAVLAELNATDAQEDALGDKQVAQRAGLQARFSRATLYNTLAEQSLAEKEYSSAWLYTLGSLAEEWPESSDLPEATGRLLLTEILPHHRWTQRNRESVIRVRGGAASATAVSKLRAIHVEPGGETKWLTGAYTSTPVKATSYSEVAESNPLRSSWSFLFLQESEGFDKNFQGHFAVVFQNEQKRYVFGGDKSVFSPGQTEVSWKGTETVATIAQAGGRIVVTDTKGQIHFLDKNLKQLTQKAISSGLASPTSLAGTSSGERLLAVGTIGGSLTIFRDTDSSLGKVASLTLPYGAVQSLAFVDGRTLAAGTADGRIHFLGRQPTGQWTLMQSVKIHSGGVLTLTVNPGSGEIISGGADGVIRRMPMSWEAFGIKVSLLEIFRSPRDKKHIEMYRALLKASELTLHQTISDTRVLTTGSERMAADAERLYYGREPVALSYHIPGGAFIRKSAEEWSWERDGLSNSLRQVSVGPNGIELVDTESGFTVVLPRGGGRDRQIRFGTGRATWPGASEVRSPTEKIGVVRYADSFLEHTENGFRVRLPERTEQDEHASLPDYTVATTLQEMSGLAEKLLRLRPTPITNDGGEVVVPRTGGMAEWAGTRNLKLFRVTRSEGPGPRSEHTSGQRRTVYEAVSINRRGPTYRARPGEDLVLDFRWRVEIADRSCCDNCPGCSVQMYVGMKGATREVSRAEIIRSSFGECFVADSMPPAHYPGSSGSTEVRLKAPPQPGLYYIVHRQEWGAGCEPLAQKLNRFSTSPQDAIAAIRVSPD